MEQTLTDLRHRPAFFKKSADHFRTLQRRNRRTGIADRHAIGKTGKVDMLRAGIWKPRTRPGSFEGIGTKGLPWLQQAKKLTGLPIAVEVATGKQVEDALHFDVDVLWIGARTTVNPFQRAGSGGCAARR